VPEGKGGDKKTNCSGGDFNTFLEEKSGEIEERKSARKLSNSQSLSQVCVVKGSSLAHRPGTHGEKSILLGESYCPIVNKKGESSKNQTEEEKHLERIGTSSWGDEGGASIGGVLHLLGKGEKKKKKKKKNRGGT